MSLQTVWEVDTHMLWGGSSLLEYLILCAKNLTLHLYFSQSIFATCLLGNCYCPHFTDEEAKVQGEVKVTSPGLHRGGQSQAVSLTPRTVVACKALHLTT